MLPSRHKSSNIVQRQIEPPVALKGYSNEQVALIKRTIAKEATNDELALFMTMCNRMQLDPWAKQIYFSKIKGRLTIMVSVDGLRLIAHRTGKISGVRRGVIRDEKGAITHGFCEIHVKGWDKPVYEETPFKEYFKDDSRFDGNWTTKPETMIKKVAECSALRIACPQELGSVYSPEEMGHEVKEVEITAENLSERFKEQTCQSSESSETQESNESLHSENSPNSSDTKESTSQQSSQEETCPPEPSLEPILQPVE